MGQDNVFGRRLRELRIHKGLKQIDLAGKVGVAPSSINLYESGQRQPSKKVIEKIAALLDVSVDYLLGAEGGHGIEGWMYDFCLDPASANYLSMAKLAKSKKISPGVIEAFIDALESREPAKAVK